MLGTQAPRRDVPQPECAARLTQVQMEMERGSNVAEVITGRVAKLISRLEPVLRNEPDTKPMAGTKEGPVLVGHALALSNQNAQLERAAEALEAVLDRLEL